MVKEIVLTIKGDHLYATITHKGHALEIEHKWDDEKLYSFDTEVMLEKSKTF